MLSTLQKIDRESSFFEANHFTNDKKLIELLTKRFQIQKRILERPLKRAPLPEDVSHLIEPEALYEFLKKHKDSSAMGKESEIYNMIYFDSRFVNDSTLHKRFLNAEVQIEEHLIKKVRELFLDSEDLYIWNSGNNLYPKGGYLGWHTNNNNADQGWRLYISYAEEPGKSFFRYLDPDTHEIVTSPDSKWNFRLFNISRAKPFWHCVYTDTFRISMGYLIQRKNYIQQKYERTYRESLKKGNFNLFERNGRWLMRNTGNFKKPSALFTEWFKIRGKTVHLFNWLKNDKKGFGQLR